MHQFHRLSTDGAKIFRSYKNATNGDLEGVALFEPDSIRWMCGKERRNKFTGQIIVGEAKKSVREYQEAVKAAAEKDSPDPKVDADEDLTLS